MQAITRLQDGNDIHLLAGDAEFIYRPVTPGVLSITIRGSDEGQFGQACLDEIRLAIRRHGRVELLIDASEATLVTVEVSKEWTRFFSEEREHLSRVSVLTGSKLIHLTVGIAQHLSYTGNLIQIYSDRELFEHALVRASAGALVDRVRRG